MDRASPASSDGHLLPIQVPTREPSKSPVFNNGAGTQSHLPIKGGVETRPRAPSSILLNKPKLQEVLLDDDRDGRVSQAVGMTVNRVSSPDGSTSDTSAATSEGGYNSTAPSSTVGSPTFKPVHFSPPVNDSFSTLTLTSPREADARPGKTSDAGRDISRGRSLSPHCRFLLPKVADGERPGSQRRVTSRTDKSDDRSLSPDPTSRLPAAIASPMLSRTTSRDRPGSPLQRASSADGARESVVHVPAGEDVMTSPSDDLGAGNRADLLDAIRERPISMIRRLSRSTETGGREEVVEVEPEQPDAEDVEDPNDDDNDDRSDDGGDERADDDDEDDEAELPRRTVKGAGVEVVHWHKESTE